MYLYKYKPDNLENIIGNKTSINSIQSWFENWHANTNTKSDAKNVCALLSGPNGIGKTLTIELFIKKYDLNPVSLNPDEKADKEYIMKNIIPSIQRNKSFTNKQNIFVIHDIDCYDDYGFISSIVNCLKETKIPVIATCNNRYEQSLKPIIPYCLDVKFQKPNVSDIVKFVKPILKKEAIIISDAKLNQIIEDANCDIRNILINLQLVCGNVTKISEITVSKDKTNSNIFELTKEFMSQNLELDDKHRLFWINNDILPLMIHENYIVNNIKMKDESSYLNNIAESIQSLSDIDLFEKDIHMNGNWEVMPYTAWHSIKSVTNCHSKAMIKFTSFFEKRVSKKQTLHYDGGSGGIIKTSSKKENKEKKERQVKTKKSPKSKIEVKQKIPNTQKLSKAKAKNAIVTSHETTNEKPVVIKRRKVKLIIED